MMETPYRQWLWEKTGAKCVENLQKHGFDAYLAENRQAAAERVLGLLSGFQSVGFGGSDTVRALGLVETLKEMGKTVYDHWEPGLTGEKIAEIRLNQGRCDGFLCSANAVAATGEIVNVDGVGNRVSATAFGPKKVIIVAGMNKVRPTLDSALARVREIAAPMRARSLGMQTPCAETGFCADCNAPQRICRVTTILHRRPMATDVAVVLVNETLGY
jgi:L-lactate utilization protein LutB